MHVKSVRLHGFKCYREQVFLDNLSPHHNCIGAPPALDRAHP